VVLRGVYPLSVAFLLALPQVASAQPSAAAQETTVAGGVLVLAAYLVLWVCFAAYLFVVFRKQRAVSEELRALQERIDESFGPTHRKE
jgi:hypothetical protein